MVSVNAAAQYLAVYVLANLVGFVRVGRGVEGAGSTLLTTIWPAWRGRDPWVGVPLAFAVLALAGFPPAVIGLVTKYVVFVRQSFQ